MGAYFLEVQTRATLNLLSPWPHATVLDVGGGHGQTTGPLVSAGFDVTVHGSSEECGERVRKWVEKGQARFEVGDLLRLPWGERSFDVVLSYRLLPHVDRWRDLIAELARVARHAVLVDYPTLRSVNVFSGLLFPFKKRVEGNTRPFTVFRDRDVAAAFASQGCRVTARRAEFFLPMALHRALASAVLARASETTAAALGLTRVLGSPVILRAERRG